ncbi:MAG: SDR family NAD(P)-dependent oxidoreductase [Myxococcota bacterium]|nr:SDR family NAD(P)-dependent oxidoreductase [Myxococcota bacterium]
MPGLKNRIAVVTGGSRGIGRGCAIELGAAGATVYVTGRSTASAGGKLPGSIEATAREVSAAGGRGIPVACDHREDDAVAALFQRVREEEGRLDILVNNAFLIPPELTSGKNFWQVPLSNWDDMIDVGTRSAYAASHFAAPLMIPQGSGLIANISSSGAAEYAWHVAYGVGKAALDRFTRDAAHELRPHGIAVISLWPGLVLTERNSGARDAIPELDFTGAESLRFTGRAVTALANDPEVLARSGEAFASRDLADRYGFTDTDGSLPNGPLHRRPGSGK